jgi:hypothetical protein
MSEFASIYPSLDEDRHGENHRNSVVLVAETRRSKWAQDLFVHDQSADGRIHPQCGIRDLGNVERGHQIQQREVEGCAISGRCAFFAKENLDA